MTTARKQAPGVRDEWMSLQAAADALGHSRSVTLTMALKGELVTQHIANRIVVRRDSVDALIAERTTALAG
jgi:hypothetical protein